MIRDVGIVIVSFNSAHVIGDLLDSIPPALGELSAVITVVDNGSSDDSVEMVQRRGGCHVILSSNDGYAGGVNTGIRALPQVRTILVLNPDVRLAAGSVEAMFAALQSTGAGIVAPKVLGADGQLFRSLRRKPTLLRAAGLGWTQRPAFDEYVSDPGTYESRHVAVWALGAALLVRRDLDTLLGGWDDSFFLYSEETDYSLRAADLGWATVYEPSAVVMHIGGASGQSSRTHTMQILNRVRLYARRHTFVPSAAYFFLALLSETKRALRGRSESRVAIEALLRPSRRPEELGCSATYIPR